MVVIVIINKDVLRLSEPATVNCKLLEFLDHNLQIMIHIYCIESVRFAWLMQTVESL